MRLSGEKAEVSYIVLAFTPSIAEMLVACLLQQTCEEVDRAQGNCSWLLFVDYHLSQKTRLRVM